MGVLDKITQMRQSGMAEDEIISSLRQQGIPPKEINESLNQSQIKSAVAGEPLAPSIRDEVPPEPPQSQGRYSPQIQESFEQPPSEENEEYYPQESYPDQGGYGRYESDAGTGTGTFIEIAEQVFSEKIKDLEKQLESISEFKAITQVKLDHALERIKRIESGMDKLQLAILDKIGSYGKTLESIKKEMSMMQDSFGKALPGMATAQPNKTVRKILRKK